MEFQDLNKDYGCFFLPCQPEFWHGGRRRRIFVGIAGQRQSQVCSVSPFDEIKDDEDFKLDREETKEIFELLKGSEHIWRQIPEKLDNHLNDGPGNINEFIFLNGKKVQAHNIRKTWLPGEALRGGPYYKRFRKVMKYENQVMHIFEGIARVLKKKEIHLTLEHCRIRERYKVKITWIDKTKQQSRI